MGSCSLEPPQKWQRRKILPYKKLYRKILIKKNSKTRPSPYMLFFGGIFGFFKRAKKLKKTFFLKAPKPRKDISEIKNGVLFFGTPSKMAKEGKFWPFLI
jgi:hypothetical protein